MVINGHACMHALGKRFQPASGIYMSCDMVFGTKRFPAQPGYVCTAVERSCWEPQLGCGTFDGGLDMVAMVGSEAASWAELNKQINMRWMVFTVTRHIDDGR